MVSISICMIVKNEEAVLRRCLDSLAGIWDEIIIVDTGSADNTKQIAQTYTSNVYDFEWQDDFAMARNFSLAKATGDYIYVADADEVLDDENKKRFLQLKQALLPEVEVVEMAYSHQFAFNTTENFAVEYRPKLFRRLRKFEFADPIHEVLRIDPIVYRSDIVVHHKPQSDHSGRDLEIFAKLVAQNKLFSSRLEMMYARELIIAGAKHDYTIAREYFQKVWETATTPESIRRAACILAHCAACTKDAGLLLDVTAAELVAQPPAEICCALGKYYLNIENIEKAISWFSGALAGAMPELVVASAGSIPLRGLADCYGLIGDKNQQEYFEKQAESWTPENTILIKGEEK